MRGVHFGVKLMETMFCVMGASFLNPTAGLIWRTHAWHSPLRRVKVTEGDCRGAGSSVCRATGLRNGGTGFPDWCWLPLDGRRPCAMAVLDLMLTFAWCLGRPVMALAPSDPMGLSPFPGACPVCCGQSWNVCALKDREAPNGRRQLSEGS